MFFIYAPSGYRFKYGFYSHNSHKPVRTSVFMLNPENYIIHP